MIKNFGSCITYIFHHQSQSTGLFIHTFFATLVSSLPCASQTAYERCEECVDEKTCGLRLVMKDVRDATAKILDHTSLADVLARVDIEKESSGLMFNI